MIRLCQLSILLLSLMMATTSRAIVVENLYEVETPITNQSRAVRLQAFKAIFEEVLIRLTADSTILLKIQPESAASYVQQYRYVNVTTNPESASAVVSIAEKSEGQLLWVQLNQTKITELLRNNSIPIWGKHRAEAVIWIAVNDGTNRYILKNKDESLLKNEFFASSIRRGLPILWPEYNYNEKKIVNYADVWAGFTSPILKLSARYSNGPVIIGRISWKGNKWNGDLTLINGKNEEMSNYQSEDYKTLIAAAMDNIANSVGKRYAVLEGTDKDDFSEIMILIDNVISEDSYRLAMNYIKDLPVVQDVRLVSIDNENVIFNVLLRSDVKDFIEIVSLNKTLKYTSSLNQEKNDEVENVQTNDPELYSFHLLN